MSSAEKVVIDKSLDDLTLGEAAFLAGLPKAQFVAEAAPLFTSNGSSAEAQAELRERALQRQRDLEARGVGAAASVEEAELAAASAQQAVLARRIALAQAESRVDQATTLLARAVIALEAAERGRFSVPASVASSASNRPGEGLESVKIGGPRR